MGDLLDRGAKSRGVMDLLMKLQPEAEAAGGKVHVLLGNHEVMNLSGELGYVIPEEFASYQDLETAEDAAAQGEALPVGFKGHRRAMQPTGAYGSWLLERPFMVVINRTAFVHGGLSESLQGLDLVSLNERARDELTRLLQARRHLIQQGVFSESTPYKTTVTNIRSLLEVAKAPPEEALAPPPDPETLAQAKHYISLFETGLPFSAEGPLWYRRTAVCHPYTEQVITERVLGALNADRVVIGHTPTLGRTIQSRMDQRVIAIDTGMNVGYYQGHPGMLVMTDGAMSVHYADIDRDEIVLQPNRMWERPYGFSDEQIEDFLRTAEVVKIEDLPVGITKPRRLTLERGDQTMRAVFKYLDTDPGLEGRRWRRTMDKADRYQNDVAAYRLDRMLGFDMVPPSVIRSVEGEEGVAQYWIENGINALSRQEQGIPYTGECRPTDQYALMNVFDVLIFNDDRNLSNVLFTRSDWKVWLIDHTRTFRSDRKLPAYLRKAQFRITPQLREVLAGIDMQRLDPLSDLLHEKQRQAVVARANELLETN